ncbi:MAG: nucleoside hydrolase [Chloroflexota bacterium]
MKKIQPLKAEKLLQRLTLPTGRIRMVLDTDTYNEIDDQFAVVHALLSPERLAVEAIYAAPFYNHLANTPGHGMALSFEEIGRLLDRLNLSADGFAFRGSAGFLDDYDHPLKSEAVNDLISRAMGAADDNPLYVVAIGALTNIASAILLEPEIIHKIVLVWLGGTALHWPHAFEFNLEGDVLASRLIFDCGVPLVMVPCTGVTTHLHTTVPEIDKHVLGKGDIGDFLAVRFKAYSDDHFGWSKEIWDIAPIAYLINSSWLPSNIVSSPILTQRTPADIRKLQSAGWHEGELMWSFDPGRHPIRYIYHLQRDPIFRDLFTKLEHYASGLIKPRRFSITP